MRIAPLVALSLAFVGTGAATAQELPTVEIRSQDSERTLVLSCTEPNSPSLKDVERVLMINDPAQTADLRKQLVDAAADACAARQPRILVARTGSGLLTWKPLES